MEHKEMKAGLDGLPPVKDQYETEEKKLIAEAADKYGARSTGLRLEIADGCCLEKTLQ